MALKLTLAQAESIIEGAFSRAADLGAKPLAIAVLDDGGHLVAFKRQDGCSLLREDIARGKAWGALGMGVSSRSLEKMAAQRPAFIQSVTAAADGRLVPAPGGLLIRFNGHIIGAVGASGDSSDVDEQCVRAGLEHAGYQIDIND